MTTSDLDGVLALDRSVAEAPHWSRQEYEHILLSVPGSVVFRLAFVAESNTQLVGLAVIRLLSGEEVAELEIIVVDPNHRRLGIGARLLMCSKQSVVQAGASAIHLEVRASNAAAIALYERHGFHRVGRRPSYYSAPREDALVFAIQLTHREMS
jgi:ribosomal-protein-alanine N-acetyltransferase